MNYIKIVLFFTVILFLPVLLFGNDLTAGACKKYKYKGVEYTFKYCPPCPRFPNGFWLSETEVTLKMYKQFIEENPNYLSSSRNVGILTSDIKKDYNSNDYSWRSVGFIQSDLHPVTLISAHDAIVFCKWLSKRLNVSIRLPYDTEWLYAASEGKDDIHSCIITEDNFFKYGNFADKKFYEFFRHTSKDEYSDGYIFTAPVKSYLPNKWGLYDMFGNVSEITIPSYLAEYYNDLIGNVSEKTAFSNKIKEFDVSLYGGSWLEKPHIILFGPKLYPFETSCFSRKSNRADNHIGFRLLLEYN